jgi:SpoVK/Ycf46/Vps4 family AAA+-type ATPase
MSDNVNKQNNKSKNDVNNKSKNDTNTKSKNDVNTKSKNDVNNKSKNDVNNKSKNDINNKSKNDINNKLDNKKLDNKKIENQKIENYDKDIDELIQMCLSNKKKTNSDYKNLSKILFPILKIKCMIGLDEIKKQIVDLILYYSQDFDNNEMMHTIICGSPGTGKTTLAKIIGEIYLSLGRLDNDKFIVAKRSDLIGAYLGQTAKNTQAVIDSAKGGVLFIDEVYSLGNARGTDSYSKECIDTLTVNLADKTKNFVCIVAGYKDDIKNCFLNYNNGLKRRFPWIFEIEAYNASELRQIFIHFVKENDWKLHNNKEVAKIEWFNKNKDEFIEQAGDMENLFVKTKISHSKRVFGERLAKKKKITQSDLDNGFKLLKSHKKYKKDKHQNDKHQYSMYI